MSLEKDWPSKLPEFYYNYNNRVHKSTRPPVEEQLPFVQPTEKEREFLPLAHVDVQISDENQEENESTYEKTDDGNKENKPHNVTLEEAKEILTEDTEQPDISQNLKTVECSYLDKVIDPVDTEDRCGQKRKEAEINVHLPMEQHAVDAMEGESPYYKEMYKRRFGEQRKQKENENSICNTPCIITGLLEYFKTQQLEFYPLEMFAADYIQDMYTPNVGAIVQFRANPAMNKGTAVFKSGFWLEGICQTVKTDTTRGKLFFY